MRKKGALKMRRKVNKKTINFLTTFLLLDLIGVFAIFKTSNATYISEAIATSEMEVALYAFRYEGVDEISGVDGGTVIDSVDIKFGDISPGETKYYKFNVYNYLMDEDGNEKLTETSISYDLKLITTTNLPLVYSLYLNQSPFSSNASSLIDSTGSTDTADIITDGFGTFYKVFPVSTKCFKLGTTLKYDQYTLAIHFPSQFSSVVYQDLIESIKIQLESKQVLPGDPVLQNKICR
jgi:hypothetical protein